MDENNLSTIGPVEYALEEIPKQITAAKAAKEEAIVYQGEAAVEVTNAKAEVTKAKAEVTKAKTASDAAWAMVDSFPATPELILASITNPQIDEICV